VFLADQTRNGLGEKEMNAQSLPLVSIVTPVYNQKESYLRETIEGILGQTYQNIEYIVLDDGSTSNVPQVLASYTGRLIQESHPNMGQVKTINKGWEMSHGEIVGLVNSDDPMLPDLVEEVVSLMLARPDVLLVYPDWLMIDEEGKTIRHTQAPDYDYLTMLRWYYCIPGPGAFFRREAFELEGMFNPQYRYIFDFDYWLRLGLHGPFARIPKTLATWRWHDDGASLAHRGLSMAQEHISLIESIYSRSDLPPGAERVRARAFSSAYTAAAESCLPAHPKEGRQYLLRSLMYHPLCPFTRPQHSLTSLVEILLGSTVASTVRSFLRVIRHNRSATSRVGD